MDPVYTFIAIIVVACIPLYLKGRQVQYDRQHPAEALQREIAKAHREQRRQRKMLRQAARGGRPSIGRAIIVGMLLGVVGAAYISFCGI